jgi:glycosyltransferase involved in cell wall biosynthesis
LDKRKLDILVLSCYAPPYNIAGALRVGRTCEHLQEFGHDVRLISASNVVSDRSIPALREIESWSVDWKDVNERARRLAGGRDRSLAITQSDKKFLTPKQKLLWHASRLFRNATNIPDMFRGWIGPAFDQASREIERRKPDLIYASILPASAAIVAEKLSKKFDIPWVCEFRDLWVANHYYSFARWRKVLDGFIQKRAIASSSALVTVSDPLASDLKAAFPTKRCEVILNGADTDLLDQLVHEPAQPSDKLKIVYTGTLYKGKRDPRVLFQAVSMLDPVLRDRVTIDFYGSDAPLYIDELATEFGIQSNVTCYGKVDYRTALIRQHQADVLLLLLWLDKSEQGVFTGKLFEYIASKRPIIAVGLDGNVAVELVRERGIGFASSNPVTLRDGLTSLLNTKLRDGAIAGLNDEALKGLTRRDQSRKLECLLLDTAAGNV